MVPSKSPKDPDSSHTPSWLEAQTLSKPSLNIHEVIEKNMSDRVYMEFQTTTPGKLDKPYNTT